jgi:amino acid adenylation domain-containing protein
MAEQCVHDVVAAHAAGRPDRVAVVADGLRLTYGELDRRAGRLAARLRRRGVRPGSVVGLLVPRSAEFVIAALAVLKAGACYLPLDPGYPADRLRLMLSTAACGTVLSTEELRGQLPDGADVELVAPAGGPEDPAGGPAAADGGPEDPAGPVDRAPVHPDDVAYTMFTSGSTGTPKAVMVTHRGIVGLLRDGGMAPLGAEDVVLHAASVSFDAATFDIWGALLNGACLVVATGRSLPVLDLGELIRAHAVTTVLLPTGLFHLVVDELVAAGRLEDLSSLRTVLAGGDVLSGAHARRFAEALPWARLVNAYGPTEATVASTTYAVPADHDPATPVPIGYPVAQASVHVLDEHLREVPGGEPGQLYVGGSGLARGYAGDPALTAQRFVPDPRACGGRLYATGDLVRLLPDGALHFLGRVDGQVKKRGFRIEPAEVELALRADAAVRDAAVLVDGETADTRRLVACVVARHGTDLAGLRERLAGVLPEYLVPDLVVAVQRLPVTTNGKVDRAALAAQVHALAATAEPAGAEQIGTQPAGTQPAGAQPAGAQPAGAQQAGAEPPGTEESGPGTGDAARPVSSEAELTAIWTEVLKIDKAGRHDDFFDLGGHSLLANRVVTQVRKRLGVRLGLDAIFDHPTIAELAAEVERARPAGSRT